MVTASIKRENDDPTLFSGVPLIHWGTLCFGGAHRMLKQRVPLWMGGTPLNDSVSSKCFYSHKLIATWGIKLERDKIEIDI